MPDHTGPLAGTLIPIVDTDGVNRKADGGKLVQLDVSGKIDPDLLPDISGTPGDGGIFVVDDL